MTTTSLRLAPEMTCFSCGGTAPLDFHAITKVLEDGAEVRIHGVPAYGCTTCANVQMDLMVRAALEEVLQRYIDEHPDEKHIEIHLQWDEPAASRKTKSKEPPRRILQLA